MKQKILITIIGICLIFLIFIMMLFLTPFGLFKITSQYFEEDGEHYKVGTTIPMFHFRNLGANIDHRFQMWHPTQDYPDDDPEWEYFFYSDSNGNYDWDIYLYLDHDGEYRFNLDWKCGGNWCTRIGGGAIFSDGYRADIDITSFTISPSTVTVGDTVTILWTVKNNGEFNGDYDWSVHNPWECDSLYNPIVESYNIPLNIGNTHSDGVTITITDDMAHPTHPEIILFGLHVSFHGSDTQYPPEWYSVWGNNAGDSRCEGITYIPPPPDISITYTLTIRTIPNNCDVNLLGVEVINSGDNGIAAFKDVLYGSYTVRVSKTGYSSSTKTMSINSDIVTSMDLTSQKYLIPILLSITAAIIIAGIVIYYHKKKN